MADAFRKIAIPHNTRPADSKFAPSSYDDARDDADGDGDRDAAAAASSSSSSSSSSSASSSTSSAAATPQAVAIPRTVTRFDPESQQDVTFYVCEFNIPLINEHIRRITRGTRRSVLADSSSSSSSSKAAHTDNGGDSGIGAAETAVDTIVCFVRFSNFEWFHDELCDLFPDAKFPALPPKSYSLFRDNSAEFIEQRRISLNAYMRTLCDKFPSILASPPLAALVKLR